MSERDQLIADVILLNMTEEQKDHYSHLIKSHDRSVKSYCNGTYISIPAIEIKFCQSLIVDSHILPQPETHS